MTWWRGKRGSMRSALITIPLKTLPMFLCYNLDVHIYKQEYLATVDAIVYLLQIRDSGGSCK